MKSNNNRINIKRRDWFLLFFSIVALILSFWAKDSGYNSDIPGTTPIPAACSLKGKIIHISEPVLSELQTGKHFHYLVSIQLEKLILSSPRDPLGHPCSEDVTRSTVVTEYKTPVSIEDTPPMIDGIPLKPGDVIWAKAAYAEGYVPLLTAYDFPKEEEEDMP